jgi:CheY-like chemotaxis protein
MRLTIVLIDDDSDDIELMQEAIAEVAPLAICIPFTNPIKAVESLSAKRHSFIPDQIIIDHNMPEMTGLECVKVLRMFKEFGSTSIAAFSTSMNDRDSKLFKSAGANFAFQKPASIREYAILLRSVLNL